MSITFEHIGAYRMLQTVACGALPPIVGAVLDSCGYSKLVGRSALFVSSVAAHFFAHTRTQDPEKNIKMSIGILCSSLTGILGGVAVPSNDTSVKICAIGIGSLCSTPLIQKVFTSERLRAIHQ